jgi:type IV pilus assembly protein PilE
LSLNRPPASLASAPAALHGFTLVECLVVVLVLGLISSIAWPSFRRHDLQAGRLDAVHALSKVQAEQERYRSAHGLYAAELGALLGTSAQSPQGRYAIRLTLQGPESYQASAQAQGQQAQDNLCGAMTVQVKLGFAQFGPEPGCWRQ